MSDIPYTDVLIFFWSGTGNSFRVAAWLGEFTHEFGCNTQLKSIDAKHPDDKIPAGKGSLVGICFPTHGFTAPWHVLKFAWKLPRNNNTHAVCITTRAGLKFGRFFVPGISGSAPFVTALILRWKGYNIRGTMSVDMPSNWFSLHPIQKDESHRTIIDRARLRVERFIERIFSPAGVWLTVNNGIEMTWGILLSWISVAYLLIGRFFLAKLFFANQNCDGCGVCKKACSVGAIELREGDRSRPYWRYNCESCMRCAAYCPHNAVEAGHSWGVLLYFITGVPMSVYVLSWVSSILPGLANLEIHWIHHILDLFYFYPALFFSYYVFHNLNRIPIINTFFVRTTMTNLPFWGRYRESAARLKDLTELKVEVK